MLKSALFSFTIIGGGVMATSGCSSVMTHTGNDQGYYPGTRASMDILRDDDTSWAMLPLVVIDLPFSAVADTLLLPYDYYQTGHHQTTARDRVLHSEEQNKTASSQSAVTPDTSL